MTIEKKKRKSGMKADRSYRVYKTFVSCLKYIYGCAVSYHFTHEKILNLYLFKIKNDPLYLRLPLYYRGRIEGYDEACRDEILQKHLVWMLSCDEKLMTNAEVSALTLEEEKHLAGTTNVSYRSPWSRIDNEKSRHVWIDKNGNPLPNCPFDAKWLDHE